MKDSCADIHSRYIQTQLSTNQTWVCLWQTSFRNIRVPEAAHAHPFDIRPDENRKVELVPERLPMPPAGITIPADPMAGLIHEHITGLPSQESDHVPTVKLQYHERVNHRGLPCGKDYPHLDRRLRRLVVFLQRVPNGGKD